MKKSGLLLLLFSLLILSCSKSDETISDQKGTLKVSSVVNDKIEIVTSRASADVNDFMLILEDEKNPDNVISGNFSEFPGGLVENIPASSYKLTLTSHPNGFLPAFEDPWYEGVREGIPVVGGQTTDVALECVQVNTGLYFTYDSSLEQLGITDIVPMVTQQDMTLIYGGDLRDSTGYFLPQSAELRIKYGDSYLPISGAESQILDFDKEQLWKIELKAKQTGGGLAISATVKVITDPTHIKEFELEGNEPTGDLLDIEILEVADTYARFLVKGTGIENLRFGLFDKESVDKVMQETGKTLEELMEINGSDLEEFYLPALNSATGLKMNFSRLEPESEYSFITVSTRGELKSAQRVDVVTLEDQTIAPDPNPDPNGPIELGIYSIDIFQDQDATTGEYIDSYDNEIEVVKAKQENLYIINNLFDVNGLSLVAEYNDNSKQLLFTGKNVKGTDVLNQIALSFNGGQYYAGILIFDQAGATTTLAVDIADRRLTSSKNIMQLNLFDPFTLDNLGWVEISPANNPYTYIGEAGTGSAKSSSRFKTRLGNPVGQGKSIDLRMTSDSSLEKKADFIGSISEIH